MDRLETLVLNHLQNRLFRPDRLIALLYQMRTENGVTDLDEILEERPGALTHDRERAKAAFDLIRDTGPSASRLLARTSPRRLAALATISNRSSPTSQRGLDNATDPATACIPAHGIFRLLRHRSCRSFPF